MVVRIVFHGLEKAMNALKQHQRARFYGQATESFARAARDYAEKQLRDSLIAYPHFKREPGLMGGGIRVETVSTGKHTTMHGVVAESINPADGFDYAKAVEVGRKEIDLPDGVMRFRNQQNRWVATSHVAGFGGHRFMWKMTEWARKSFRRYCEVHVDRAIKTYGADQTYRMQFEV